MMLVVRLIECGIGVLWEMRLLKLLVFWVLGNEEDERENARDDDEKAIAVAAILAETSAF